MDTEIKDRFLMKFDKANTVKTYKGNIDGFYEFVLSRKTFNTDKELLSAIDFNDVEDYFYDMKKSNQYKKSTMNLKINVLNEFFDFAIKRRVMSFNLTDTIDRFSKEEVKKDQTKKYIPSIQEIKRLINASYDKKPDGRCQDFNNVRNRFFIALLTSTGMRVDEALGIELSDIEYVSNGCYMININGERVKNGMDKRVPIPKSIISIFEEYKIRRMIRNEKFKSNLLFFGMRGKKLSGSRTNEILEEYCQRSNMDIHITNHCFRHFLTEYLRSKGYDIGLVYKIMGWYEDGIITNYHGEATDKAYDELKLKMCDVLG
ncbi:tyrosine-type recombinase/integrase [Clostridium sp.]|uniref:tyrosine-type recombinase/integrase n=1 Tax=Clostridium sp. TaxID=1506 RepID=UPI002909817C|nr:tyrosine-type recombinase/integrase [Clostridium sp.]MDU3410036.1 tyrosine-type recombinase/integrase [Clostridium sp.]